MASSTSRSTTTTPSFLEGFYRHSMRYPLEIRVENVNVERNANVDVDVNIDYSTKYFYYGRFAEQSGEEKIIKGEELYSIVKNSGRIGHRYAHLECHELSYYDWKYIIEEILTELPGYITTNYWNTFEEAENAVRRYKQAIKQYKKDLNDVDEIRSIKLESLRKNSVNEEEIDNVVEEVEQLTAKYDTIRGEMYEVECV